MKQTLWQLFNTTAICWAPADEGGGGGGDEGGDNGGSDDGGDGADGGEQSAESLMDLADKKGDAGDADKDKGDNGDYTAPDYLAEHLQGKDPDDTLKKLHTAYKGARDAVAKGKGSLEGEVPDKPESYEFKDQGTKEEPDKVFTELTSEASKPFVEYAQKAAHKAGLPDKAFDAFMRDFVANAGEAGMPIGATDDEAQQISREAEMEALTEITGSGAAAKEVVNMVGNFGQNLLDRGDITKDDLAEFNIMVGTAESAHLFQRIMVSQFGEKPIPRADGGEGKITGTDAYALHAKALALPQGAERDAALADAKKAMQQAYGAESSGSVPSQVL